MIRLLLKIFVIALLVLINIRLYYYPPATGKIYGNDEVVLTQLHHLDDRLEKGAAQMQLIFPEGALFLYSLYGLSWAELALANPEDVKLQKEALEKSQYALQLYLDDPVKYKFGRVESPEMGAFYVGWSNYLRAKILLLSGEHSAKSTLLEDYKENCAIIADALEAQRSPHLQTYLNYAWPADGLLGVASLNMYEQIVDTSYKKVVATYLMKTRALLEPELELIPHGVSAESGISVESPRGASQVLMIRLLGEIDPDFAAEQFKQFRRHFVTTWLGLPAVREYPLGEPGLGDIDSGPVIFGIGAAASVVSIAAFQAVGDTILAKNVNAGIEAFGFPFSWQGKRRYAAGMLEVGDAFLAWSRSTPNYVQRADIQDVGYGGSNWRLKFQIISLFILLLLFSRQIYRKVISKK